MSTELATLNEEKRAVDAYRMSTDAASLCKSIVLASVQNIAGKKYIRVEGWQAIAIAHGCTASSGDVERTETGFKAIGKVIRMSDGMVLSQAEGFVGDDEKTWGSRAEYAKRAMAQTRAISRACRSAFAHVVVMMNAGLSTTPAEEVTSEGFEESPRTQSQPQTQQQKPEGQPAHGDSTPPQHGAINALLTKLGVKDEMARHERVSKIVGLDHVIGTMKELSKKQASTAIELLGKECNG